MKALVTLLVVGAVMLGGGGFVLGYLGDSKASKTSSETAQAVRSLKAIQKFDHRQTVNAENQARNSQAKLRTVVHGIEKHIDHTITTSIEAQAQTFRHALGQ